MAADVTQERLDATLTVAGYRAWLATFGPGEVVGATCDPCGCPVRRFLADRGLPGAHVEYELAWFPRPEDAPLDACGRTCRTCRLEGHVHCRACHLVLDLPATFAAIIRWTDALEEVPERAGLAHVAAAEAMAVVHHVTRGGRHAP
jgi:hypothetical protein